MRELSEDLVTIAHYNNAQEASLAKAALEDDGVTSYLSGTESSNMLWLVGSALGGVKLQVTTRDAERATAILDSLKHVEQPNRRREWTCPQCGEQVDAGFDVCWSCESSFEQGAEKLPTTATPTETKEDDSPVENRAGEASADELALRAFRSAMYGMAFFPFLIGFLPFMYYSLSLMFRLPAQELSGRGLFRYYGTVFIIVILYPAFTWFFFDWFFGI